MAKEEQLNNNNWRNATGKIDYQMTNDYMFRMVLQSKNNVLKGLISSMMHISYDDIDLVEIINPVTPGKYIEDKDFIMDIKVKLNNSSIINLEMQVADYKNWQNRSLSYLCRTFDNVQKGEDYNSVNDVTQIGFLDYDLFPDELEFYSKYMLQNVKNHKIYNSNFCLCVLSLNQIELATKEDKKWHIDEWARLFKATTWEELKMIAEKNSIYSEAADSIYLQNSEQTIRDMCEARREAVFHEKYVQKQLANKDAIIADKDAIIADKDAQIAENEALIKQLLEENDNLKKQV